MTDARNRDTQGHEQGKSVSRNKRRGRRIPQTAWPGILQKYQLGATLTAIGEEFDCTPSAISYIVKRAEEIYGDLTGAHHLPVPVRRTTGTVHNPSQLAPRSPEIESTASQRPEPVDEMEQRLVENTDALLTSYRAWQLSNTGEKAADEQPAEAEPAMKLAEQLHEMRRSLAKLEIMLSQNGLQGGTVSAQRAPRARYAQGWTPA